MTRFATIQLATYTEAEWTAWDGILLKGQHAYSSDALYTGTNQMRYKVGNGTDVWTDLNYVPGPDPSSITWITGNLSPLDATTYYAGYGRTFIPTVTATDQDFNIGKTLTITGALIAVLNSGTAGTTETTTIKLRNVTQATSHTIGTGVLTNGTTSYTFNGLSIPVASIDNITLEILCPTWLTNPTVISYSITLFYTLN